MLTLPAKYHRSKAPNRRVRIDLIINGAKIYIAVNRKRRTLVIVVHNAAKPASQLAAEGTTEMYCNYALKLTVRN